MSPAREKATEAVAAEAAAGGGAAVSPPSKGVATPWGKAGLVEEVWLEQQADGRTFASLVQLVETAGGERLVRFAYTTDGVARRGPVTLRRGDLDRLGAELAERPGLAAMLRFGGGA
jgi:hypothetical protein